MLRHGLPGLKISHGSKTQDGIYSLAALSDKCVQHSHPMTYLIKVCALFRLSDLEKKASSLPFCVVL